MRSRFLPCLLLLAFACSAPPSPNTPSSSESAQPPYQRPRDLTGAELRSYDSYLNRFPSPCGGDDTIALCLDSSRSCRACPAAAKFVAKSIRAGFVEAEVEARYLARFDPAAVHVIDIQGAPIKGPDDAAVTIIEFADFQCPFCSVAVQVLDSLVATYAPHVRVVFKDFPIKYHPHAQSTSQAGVAAHNQGKFWELHHMMFANRDRLDRPEVERYARSLNLDMKRFMQDWDSESTVTRVRASYDQGVNLGVKGTPFFFINGRAFEINLFDFGGEDLLSWIELEIELATGKPYKR